MPHTPSTEPSAPAGLWVGWAAFAGVALAGFCFGVWAGTQKPERVVVQAPAPVPEAPPAKPPEPKPEAKPQPPPEPKPTPEPTRESVAAAPPKTEPPAEAMKPDPTPEPKPPEPKKPDPKPPEPKKPDPKKSAAPAVTFAKDVLPVFRANCNNCHGAVGQPKGGLNLQTLAAVTKGGNSGPGVKAGDPDGSPVWTSINDGTMPPNGKKLTEKEKKTVRDWIEAGAK